MHPQSRFATRFGAACLGAALAASAAGACAQAPAQAPAAQTPAIHAHDAPAGAHAGGPARADTLTAAARAQLAAVRRSTAALATPAAARAAGYRPVFGDVPLQGEHYVRIDRVLADTFDVEHPSVLLFAPVAGRPTLVGVAYAFLHPVGTPPPAGFDAAGDVWHTHDGLTQTPGRHIVMMHAWFVDAPGGAFARDNPWLPYLAAGLTPPSAATLADSASGERARRLGLALASASTPPMLFRWIARQADTALAARTEPHRAAIAALVPQLAAAERAGDRAAEQRLSAAAIEHGDALVAAYRGAVPDRPLVARLVDRTVDQFLGRGHGIEDELGALRRGGGAGGDAAPEHHAHGR